jgi:hypothetical protein
MSLPKFKYHPDPVGTGQVEASETECLCCEQARGFVYVGPIYTEHEGLDESICPWCIHDGSAHEKFEAMFTDDSVLVEEVPDEVMAEVAYRTPGFLGWQEEHWLICCEDAAVFLGQAGQAELESKFPAAIAEVQEECGLEDEEWEEYFDALMKNGSPTAYVFQCLHCQKLLAYSDSE